MASSILRNLRMFADEEEASQRKVQANQQLWRVAQAALTVTPAETVAALVGAAGGAAGPASAGSGTAPRAEWDTPVLSHRALPGAGSNPDALLRGSRPPSLGTPCQSPSPLAPARCLLRSPLLAQLVAQHTGDGPPRAGGAVGWPHGPTSPVVESPCMSPSWASRSPAAAAPASPTRTNRRFIGGDEWAGLLTSTTWDTKALDMLHSVFCLHQVLSSPKPSEWSR